MEPDMKQAIQTPAAPAPRGPYSQGMLATGRHLYVAAQGPLDPDTGKIAGEAFAVQARRTLENVKAVLEAGGASLADVVRITVYLADWKYLGELNEIYGDYFHAPCPARIPIQMAVPLGLIMMDAIAAIAEPKGETR
jgi:2-iminobutanoate/2-iminopropanoate deaminase